MSIAGAKGVTSGSTSISNVVIYIGHVKLCELKSKHASARDGDTEGAEVVLLTSLASFSCQAVRPHLNSSRRPFHLLY